LGIKEGYLVEELGFSPGEQKASAKAMLLPAVVVVKVSGSQNRESVFLATIFALILFGTV
jgi:hypothetical protein